MNIGIETESLEFKKSTSEMKEACVSIVAMLNKHGLGTLYFGVRNNGDVIGQQISDATLRDVAHQIAGSVKPQVYPTITKESFDGNDVIKVEINGHEKPYSTGGRYYIRVADEDQQMTAAKLRNYFIEESGLSIWEQSESEGTYKDIDKRTLKRFVENAIAAGRLPEDAKADVSLLRHLGLLNKNKLNNAGAVLFSKKTKVWVQMAIFATDEKLTFIDMASGEDNILNLLDKTERYILQNIHWKAQIIGMEREEIPEIPIAVIREALANSFAHALYNSQTKHEICIHPNMITIYNPGSYASTYSPEEYIRGNIPSSIRNELIAKILYLNKSIEKFGSGFKRMHSLSADAGISFSYEKYDTGFKVVLHRNKGTHNVPINVLENVTLNPTEKTVYLLVSQNPRATKAEIANKISKTERTVQRALDSLKEKEFIERAGSKKTGYWIIK